MRSSSFYKEFHLSQKLLVQELPNPTPTPLFQVLTHGPPRNSFWRWDSAKAAITQSVAAKNIETLIEKMLRLWWRRNSNGASANVDGNLINWSLAQEMEIHGQICLISFRKINSWKAFHKKCLYLHTCVLVYVKDKLSYHRYNSSATLVANSEGDVGTWLLPPRSKRWSLPWILLMPSAKRFLWYCSSSQRFPELSSACYDQGVFVWN